jgi:hypothetical protein
LAVVNKEGVEMVDIERTGEILGYVALYVLGGLFCVSLSSLMILGTLKLWHDILLLLR